MANGFVMGIDTLTQGQWIGKFGGGYWSAKLAGGLTPPWITSYSFSGGSSNTLTNPNTDSYMQTPGSTDSNSVYQLGSNAGHVTLTMADNGVYVTSIYLLSSTSSRRMSVKLQNTAGDVTYDTYSDPVAWSSQGRWYRICHWGGDCRLRIESISGTVPVCGVVFDRYDFQFGNYCEGVL